MLGWFKRKKALRELKNAVGLSEEALDLLTKSFGNLAKIADDFPDRALAYVVDGVDDGILSDVKLTGAGHALGLERKDYSILAYTRLIPEGDTTKEQFFEKVNVTDFTFFLRLAEFYDAASEGLRWTSLQNSNVPEWMEVFLREVTWWKERYETTSVNFGFDILEKMAVAKGLSEDFCVRTAFYMDASNGEFNKRANIFYFLKGFSDAVLTRKGIVEEALADKSAGRKVHALTLLKEVNVPVEPFIHTIVDLALTCSTTIRRCTEPLLKQAPDAAVPHIVKHLQSNKSAQRETASQLIVMLLGDEKACEILQRYLSSDQLPPVHEIEQYELPPITDPNNIAPLPPSVLMHLRYAFEVHNLEAEKRRRRHPEYANGLQSISMNLIDHRFKLMQGDSQTKGSGEECKANKLTFSYALEEVITKQIIEFSKLPDLELIHLVRLGIITGLILIDKSSGVSFTRSFRSCLRNHEQVKGYSVGLRELASVFRAIELEVDQIGWNVLRYSATQWNDDQLWPYFAENMQIVDGALGIRTLPEVVRKDEIPEVRRCALEILTKFPKPPVHLIPALWDFAFGSLATARPLAVKCLDKLSDKKPKILEGLKNKKAEARITAADWLARLGDRDTVPVIREALKKEKDESVKVALMNALEALGVPIEELLDNSEIAKEAEEGLKNGIPETLSWFPFSHLPKVRMKDTNEEVPRNVLIWRIVQHQKVGNPEPGPMLIRYCSMLNQSDREELAQFVLNAWIAEDTKPRRTQAEIEAQARIRADYLEQHDPQHYTWQSAYLETCKNLMKDIERTAVKEKGILAITAACGGSQLAPVVQKYLKVWYGQRMHQCKALVRMLSWVDHPAAVQVLLATATRFRTKGIQEEAAACVSTLAERKGWSVDQLADRTIPTAGFDENRELELDYGARTFIARVDSSFNIAIFNAEGQTIKSLPDPGKDDDQELAKEAKKSFSNAKKELKSVLQMQRDRLYEAMCTQRTWTYDDWNTYLNGHPIVRSYCQSLVWKASEEGKPDLTFRPLDDGTITDAQDSELTVSPDASVKLAHTCTIPEDEGKAWIKHFKDYEVTPLFEQFTRPVYKLPDSDEATEITDFEGHIIDSRKLRSKAEKLGYTHSQAEDGGCFFYHIKRFPSLGIEANIEHTGIYIGDSTVFPKAALKSLYFNKISEDSVQNFYESSQVTLAEVPPVLLSECWNDVRLIAAEGTGYDDNWEKITAE